MKQLRRGSSEPRYYHDEDHEKKKTTLYTRRVVSTGTNQMNQGKSFFSSSPPQQEKQQEEEILRSSSSSSSSTTDDLWSRNMLVLKRIRFPFVLLLLLSIFSVALSTSPMASSTRTTTTITSRSSLSSMNKYIPHPRHVQESRDLASKLLDASHRNLIVDENCPIVLSADQVDPRWNLDLSFYKKYVQAIGGIPIIGSDKVSDEALVKVAMIFNAMVANLPFQVPERMADLRMRIAVMAMTEVTTNIPEHAHLSSIAPDWDWDTKTRGLSADCSTLTASVAEENALCWESDPYFGESIVVHEIAHSIHELGIQQMFPDFFENTIQHYCQRDISVYKPTVYAATSFREYFAESAQSFLNANRLALNGGSNVNPDFFTREQLLSKNKCAFDTMTKVFGEQDPGFSYSCTKAFKDYTGEVSCEPYTVRNRKYDDSQECIIRDTECPSNDDSYCPISSLDIVVIKTRKPTKLRTSSPSTSEPTTEAPTTRAPVTKAPTTKAPVTKAPTLEPTFEPTPEPTFEPTPEPTFEPTPEPTARQPNTRKPTSNKSTPKPTNDETNAPTFKNKPPTGRGTDKPTPSPTEEDEDGGVVVVEKKQSYVSRGSVPFEPFHHQTERFKKNVCEKLTLIIFAIQDCSDQLLVIDKISKTDSDTLSVAFTVMNPPNDWISKPDEDKLDLIDEVVRLSVLSASGTTPPTKETKNDSVPISYDILVYVGGAAGGLMLLLAGGFAMNRRRLRNESKRLSMAASQTSGALAIPANHPDIPDVVVIDVPIKSKRTSRTFIKSEPTMAGDPQYYETTLPVTVAVPEHNASIPPRSPPGLSRTSLGFSNAPALAKPPPPPPPRPAMYNNNARMDDDDYND